MKPSRKTSKIKVFFHTFTMQLAELEAYYRQIRIENYEQNKIPNIKLRKFFRPLISCILKLYKTFSGRKITVLNRNKYNNSKKTIIFACSHVARYDIETAIEAIKCPAFLFFGDPGEAYKNFNGFLLSINGSIYVDTFDKTDRFISKETSIRILQNGGNILIYPEGAWNTTENLPIMPLFSGTAEMAIRAGTDIVPVSVEAVGKEYIINFGDAIEGNKFSLDEKRKLTFLLRDTMASLKWEIWEHQGVFKRDDLPSDMSAQFLNSIMSETENGYTLEMIYKRRYHVKYSTADEVFAHLDTLIPCKINAFLFNKRLSII